MTHSDPAKAGPSAPGDAQHAGAANHAGDAPHPGAATHVDEAPHPDAGQHAGETPHPGAAQRAGETPHPNAAPVRDDARIPRKAQPAARGRSSGLDAAAAARDGSGSSPRPGRSARGDSPFANQVRRLLRTRALGREIRAFTEVESTNSIAAEWIAAGGAPHGAVVVADHQMRGRGRMGRSWLAAPGLNLTFSVILRPDLPTDRFGMMTVAGCAGVARCIDRFAEPLHAAVKWPNDIFLNGRKVCGMLLEASWNTPASRPAVVLGVGLNVNQEEFPDSIRDRATSLLLETGRIVPRAELLAALLSDLEEALNHLSIDEEAVRREYVERMTGLGERVELRFTSSDRSVEGLVQGIDPSGGIVLTSDSGSRVFYAGEVTRSNV